MRDARVPKGGCKRGGGSGRPAGMAPAGARTESGPGAHAAVAVAGHDPVGKKAQRRHGDVVRRIGGEGRQEAGRQILATLQQPADAGRQPCQQNQPPERQHGQQPHAHNRGVRARGRRGGGVAGMPDMQTL